MDDYFLFDLVFIKKIIKLVFYLKKPTGFGSVQLFKKKPVQTGLARFFSV